MGTEFELKLATSKSGLRRALALPWLKKLASDNDLKRQRLVSVYFDTRDLALRDHGVSLRVRRDGGRRLQTIKANSGGLMERKEWEAEIEGDRPNLKLARGTALAPILTDEIARHLQPVLETRIERTVMPLRIGHSQIELALDAGRVATADSSVAIAEIELELKHGEGRDVARLARRLAQEVPVTSGARAKAEWGYALLDGTSNAPVFAETPELAASATTAEAFCDIGFACLRQIAGNEQAARQRDPEGIHQMRVGLRRLRAALSFFKDMLQGPETERIKEELKWLTDQLGLARDSDVFVRKTIKPYIEHHAESPEFEMLARDLERERSAGLARARTAIESDRFRRLLLDCALWFIGEWRHDEDSLKRMQRERSARLFAAEELERRTAKIVKRARKLDRLDATHRHKLRIAVKKVRYAREFFASLNPGDLRPKASRKIDRALKRLQKVLGDLNDMRVHMDWARGVARGNAQSRKAFAIGYLTGRENVHTTQLLANALAAGKSLGKAAS